MKFDWSMCERAQRLLQQGHLSEVSARIVSGQSALPPPAILTPSPFRPPPGLEPPGDPPFSSSQTFFIFEAAPEVGPAVALPRQRPTRRGRGGSGRGGAAR